MCTDATRARHKEVLIIRHSNYKITVQIFCNLLAQFSNSALTVSLFGW